MPEESPLAASGHRHLPMPAEMWMVERLPVALRQDREKLSEQALFRILFVEIQNKQPSFGLTS
jgi:hypothetical protein